MLKLFRSQGRKAGLPPGTTVAHEGSATTPAVIRVHDWSPTHLEEIHPAGVGDAAKYREVESVTWVDVQGIHDVEALHALEKAFDLDPLLVEDIANPSQNPKFEEYSGQLFVVLKMLHRDEATGVMRIEQVSLVMGKGWLLSFREGETDPFAPLRERIRQDNSRMRQRDVNYLAYRLADTIVDQYFVALEGMGEDLEDLEEALYRGDDEDTVDEVFAARRQLILLRRHVTPVREVLGAWRRTDHELMGDGVDRFLRDVQDHALQVQELVLTYREMVSGLLDLHQTAVSNRMNEVMKVLTIISTIFIPLGFLAGLYGMNFDHMPELHWKYGYPALLGVMGTLAAGMLLYFRRKRWI